MKQKIFALFLILCGLCLNLKAETQGDVVGRVLDDSGAPLAGATVQILHAKGGVITDEDGYFRIPYSKDGESEGELCGLSDSDFRTESG